MVNWHRKWAVFRFFKKSKISQSQIMIKSNHKSWTLFQRPRQKVGGGKWWAPAHDHFYAAQNLKNHFQKLCIFTKQFERFPIFLLFHTFWIFKNALPIIKKSVWWIFQNKKSEMYIFFVFPCRSSWNMTFFSVSKPVWW